MSSHGGSAAPKRNLGGVTLDGLAGRTHQSDWLTIDQARIDAFADITGDHNPLHVDPVWAARYSPYKTTIAHGFLTLSLLSHLADGLLERRPGMVSVNYGLDRVRLIAPVPVGSRIRASFTIASVEPRATGTILRVKAEVELEGAARHVLAADWLLFVTQAA
jgi:acyl dehydratase